MQPGDIRIESADAELDFEELRDDEEEPASPASAMSDDGAMIDQVGLHGGGYMVVFAWGWLHGGGCTGVAWRMLAWRMEHGR